QKRESRSFLVAMLLGTTAKTSERENPQGPATSFVVACALAPVGGALGYKRTEPSRLTRGARVGLVMTSSKRVALTTEVRRSELDRERAAGLRFDIKIDKVG